MLVLEAIEVLSLVDVLSLVEAAVSLVETETVVEEEEGAEVTTEAAPVLATLVDEEEVAGVKLILHTQPEMEPGELI